MAAAKVPETDDYATELRGDTEPLAEAMNERIANILAGTSGTSFIGGLTLAQVNEWLQAGAFVVAIISGLCAARFYWKKSK